jgi:uncharacterized membrane protein
MTGTLAFWKTAHILSAAVVFGTGLGIAFFCWFGYRRAMRDGDIGVLRSTLHLTVVADAWLTAPAVVFQAVSGVVLMTLLGWPLLSPWSIAVWSLFVFTGACWLPVVWIQVQQMREAKGVASFAALSEQFHGRFRVWIALGVWAFAAVIAIYFLMVAKLLSVSGV